MSSEALRIFAGGSMIVGALASLRTAGRTLRGRTWLRAKSLSGFGNLIFGVVFLLYPIGSMPFLLGGSLGLMLALAGNRERQRIPEEFRRRP
jgi:hypothetical protein